jgi:hypothetical protein
MAALQWAQWSIYGSCFEPNLRPTYSARQMALIFDAPYRPLMSPGNRSKTAD